MNEHWIEVVVVGLRQETERVKTFTLTSKEWTLPTWSAGAHIQVRLPSGTVRQYSLMRSRTPNSYDIAVLHEASGRGGSKEMHALTEGARLFISKPANHFSLVEDGASHVLIAGGIGITPIISMARELHQQGRDWRLIYCSRTRDQAALVEEVEQLGDGNTTFIFDNGDPSQGLDIQSLFNSLEADAHVYVCGPRGLIDAISATGTARGWAQANLHWEVFAPSSQNDDRVRATNSLFQVELRRSGLLLEVRPSESLLDVVRRAGIHVESACEKGYCGTCLTAVLEGVPDHQDDDLLSDEERASNRIMTICCSRSCTPKLVLDL